MEFRRVTFLFTGFLFGTIFFSSCIMNEPRYCRDFNELARSQKEEVVRNNSIETNFALIWCSYYTEGGPVIADVPIIEGGEASVPFLISKLDSIDGTEQYSAISLLFDIDRRQKLQNRAAILTKIEWTINGMKDEIDRKYSLELLKRMKDSNVQ
jgi:hypothetical protein